MQKTQIQSRDTKVLHPQQASQDLRSRYLQKLLLFWVSPLLTWADTWFQKLVLPVTAIDGKLVKAVTAGVSFYMKNETSYHK